MKVKAKGLSDTWVGFYRHLRRRGGDVFTLDSDKDFSPKWMERVADDAPETRPASAKDLGRSEPRQGMGLSIAPEPEPQGTVI